MTAPASPRYAPLGYYFLRVVDFPTDHAALEFPTALRLFDQHDDFPTKIAPARVKGLSTDLEAFEVTTFTEYFSTIFAGTDWHDHYIRPSAFRAFLWPAEKMLIAAAGRDVVNGFVKTVKENSGGVVYLQGQTVEIEKLTANTPDARALTLQQATDSGLPGHIRRLEVVGRSVEKSSEVQSYKARGGVGSGVEFDYPFEGIAEIRLSVTSDASIRLHNHLGDRGDPNIPTELRVVRACWKDRVEQFASVRTGLPKAPKKGHGPAAIKGQQTLDKFLEPGS
jgi:hypothetical protein